MTPTRMGTESGTEVQENRTSWRDRAWHLVEREESRPARAPLFPAYLSPLGVYREVLMQFVHGKGWNDFKTRWEPLKGRGEQNRGESSRLISPDATGAVLYLYS